MSIGQRMKAAREKAGMTQNELGGKIGVSGVAIMRYEKEQRQPRIEQLQRIADALDVTTDYLLGNSSEKALYEKLDNIYFNAIMKWSEDEFFTEEERTEIKLHFSDLLGRYKKLIENTVNCKISLRRYLESISSFNSKSEKPLTRQQLVERYLSQELEHERNDLKAWIDVAPYRFSLAMAKSIDSGEVTKEEEKDTPPEDK